VFAETKEKVHPLTTKHFFQLPLFLVSPVSVSKFNSHTSREHNPSCLIIVPVLTPRSRTLQPEVLDARDKSRHLRQPVQEDRRHDSSANSTALLLVELLSERSAELGVEATAEHKRVRGEWDQSRVVVDLAADAKKLSAALDLLAADVI
jgi:hypothetical protein